MELDDVIRGYNKIQNKFLGISKLKKMIGIKMTCLVLHQVIFIPIKKEWIVDTCWGNYL